MKHHATTKRQRLCDNCSSTTESDRKRLNKSSCTTNFNDVYSKVLCQKDYLAIICSFLRIGDVFRIFPSLSTYHINYLNNKSQLNMIKQCLYYDFGDILNLFKISLDTNQSDDKNNNNCNSICFQIGRFYDDWNYLLKCAKSAQLDVVVHKRNYFDDYVLDASMLMKLEKSEGIHHWLKKVTSLGCSRASLYTCIFHN